MTDQDEHSCEAIDHESEGRSSAKDPEAIVYHECEDDTDPYDFDGIVPTYFVIEQTQESVCSGDERTKVVATTTLPYKAICKLYMKAKSGHNFIGTGWMSHTNKLYTAGHNVYDARYGGWMDSILVVPGLAGTTKPYGEYSAQSMLATNGWINGASKRYDMGAIKLSTHVSHSDVLTPMLTDANEVTVCGYPSDRDVGIFQYKMRDAIRKSGGQFVYQIDTFGGQSGSPLLRDNSHAIGIHNYGGCDNKASDLYEKFIDDVNKW